MTTRSWKCEIPTNELERPLRWQSVECLEVERAEKRDRVKGKTAVEMSWWDLFQLIIVDIKFSERANEKN